jgi:phosphoribosylanthranilate isomerase
MYHGYAGGLGPDNLAHEIPRIAKAAGDARVWLDMESGVRSNNDKQFDLDKVLQCLEIAKPFVRCSR